MENKKNNTNDEYITINIDDTNINSDEFNRNMEENSKSTKRHKHNEKGRRAARIDKNGREKKKKKEKKKWSKKKKIIFWSIILGIILLIGVVFGVYIYKADGNVKDAVLNVATDIVGDKDPIFVLVLGISEDISVELTDTIMLCRLQSKYSKSIYAFNS